MNTADRELVAVPDAEATMQGESSRYRLGVRPTSPEATFTVGETGPNGQNFPWIYLRGDGGATYEIDLIDSELTVTSRPDGTNVQAVVYKIDVEAMTGQVIKEGEALRITFAYDTKSIDETAEIEGWVATTGPRYIEELRARLGKTDSVVVEMQTDVGAAKATGRFGEASRAPRSAQPIGGEQEFDIYSTIGRFDAASSQPAPAVDIESDDAIEETDGLDEEVIEPDAVQIIDPATGIVYVGRKWRRGQKTTFRNLRNASYRVAILMLVNGESATVVLQHPKGVPAMQLTTRHGVVRQFLDDKAWDQPLIPGSPLTVNVTEPMDGDRPIPRGMVAMAPVDEVVATGPQAKGPLRYPKSNALAHYRQREQELTASRPSSNPKKRAGNGRQTPSRNLVA